MPRQPEPSPSHDQGADGSPDEPTRWATRLHHQLLTQPVTRSPVEVVGHLLAVQAQDPRAMRLAIRSRSLGLTAADVDHALHEDRSLVVTWLNRGTLHLVTSDDYWWLHPLTAHRQQRWNATRLAQEGVTVHQIERGIELIVQAVAAGPCTRHELRGHLDAGGIPTARQALVHVLIAASLAGEVVRGPIIDGEVAYASTIGWLGPRPAPLDHDDALARLAGRYLASHAPASPADLAKWAGITLTDARRAIHLADAATVPAAPEVRPVGWPRPRLLGGFDPILLGWVDRTFVTGAHRSIVTTNGLFRPIALVDGRAVATWGLAGGRITIAPLEPIPAAARAALDADAAEVLAYLELA